METNNLVIRGARVHNLKSIDLDLPRQQLICFTGVSGSGKSSLAFDTIYAEGQRRYVESLSAYARQFLGKMEKPDVDEITGLSPTISIEQKTAGRNPRSTVGTMTEIYDYLRILFARIGKPYCSVCKTPIGAQSRDGIVNRILNLVEGSRVYLLAPLIQGRKGEYQDLFEDLQREGYLRVRVDNRILVLGNVPKLERYIRHDIDVVVDRFIVRSGSRGRISEAVDIALLLGKGTLIVRSEEGDDLLLSSNFACSVCGQNAIEPTPQLFSFNNPQGMCPTCRGLGIRNEMDKDRVISDFQLSLMGGAIAPIGIPTNRWKIHYYEGVLKRHGVGLYTPWEEIPSKGQEELLYGVSERIQLVWERRNGSLLKHQDIFGGILPPLERQYAETRSPVVKRRLGIYMQTGTCSNCKGTRLVREALAIKIDGFSLPDVTSMSVKDVFAFFKELRMSKLQQNIAEDALKEIIGRLKFLLNVGLDYLTLDRTAPTLSGGESQRIRLAGQIGSGLVGVTYVLDEPSIGLHHLDNRRLLDALCHLRDAGNTVIVVEHDQETIQLADRVIDFGPGPGHLGGEVVAEGSWRQVARTRGSVTGAYLSGKRSIPVPARRQPNGKFLKIEGAKQNNLKDLDVRFPLGVLTCVTGVSGSGKSSLIHDILYRELERKLNRTETDLGTFRRIEGVENLDKVIEINQQPIGRTPRSNPATYIGAFTPIRLLFSELPESKVRGYLQGRFSFNVKGGRCEACQGMGANFVEMDFLADVWVPCSICEGRRFNHDTLDVKYKGASISDILEMEIETANNFFKPVPQIHSVLQVMVEVGMGYVKLGQPAPTLSGGEAQRVKLGKELCRKTTGRTLYILDEPTTGLHFSDIQNLLGVLHRLVDLGNTVVVVEHNLDVIKTADWVIDLGPEGGEKGGELIAVGTPEEVTRVKSSYTGNALQGVLNGGEPFSFSSRKTGKRVGRRRKRWTRKIEVVGARENNLKSVNATIPRDKLTVVSGVSGSGKSSLALDTVFAEGQRRYVESLSAYARQFLGQIPKPKVDRVIGLSPAIAIEQKAVSKNPRSTVGTVTEVYDYLRALFALLGNVICPDCYVPAGAQSVKEIVIRILENSPGRLIYILAPLDLGRGEDYNSLIGRMRKKNYLRGRLDGHVFNLKDKVEIDYRQKHKLEILVDRVTALPRSRKRIAESTEKALALSKGIVIVASPDDSGEIRYSQHLSCSTCGRSFNAVTPQQLSFNSPDGWCSMCEGLGIQKGVGENVIIPESRKTLEEGAVTAWGPLRGGLLSKMMELVGSVAGFDLKMPVNEMSPKARNILLYGLGNHWIESPNCFRFQYKGILPTLEELIRLSPRFRKQMGEFVQDVPCLVCQGMKLNSESAAVCLRGKTLPEIVNLPIADLRLWFEKMVLESREQKIAGEVVDQIKSRLQFLDEVGLGYLVLARRAPTLSGGEAQRIRLASQIGSGLTGVLYVLDEPTIGLHHRDNRRLLKSLKRLRDLGNSLLVVEHDRETLENADYILDFGPGAGRKGGQIVAAGKPGQLGLSRRSLTAHFLKGNLEIKIPFRRCSGRRALEVVGARKNNLKDLTVRFPLGVLTCVTGVSGSGKSSLVNDILYGALFLRTNRLRANCEEYQEVRGLEEIDKVIKIDQTPIGLSLRSNPATYIKVFDVFRELFSQIPEAKVRGYSAGQFSFNTKRGRCEACAGLGARCIEMHFLPDVWVTCEVCKGKRYNQDVLEVLYKGRSIADVLELTVSESLVYFQNVPGIWRPLKMLDDVGLGYLKLGQASTTLSGGEAQRVKLSRELSKLSSGRTVYILDEPTTGLHFADVKKLLEVLNRLVDAGNTVVVIEHNLDLIKTADWVIDLGPEGGNEGGYLVAEGTPESVSQVEVSHTGRFLKEILQEKRDNG